MILLNEIHRLAPVKSCIRPLGQGQTDVEAIKCKM